MRKAIWGFSPGANTNTQEANRALFSPDMASTFSMDLSLGTSVLQPTLWNDLEDSEHSGKSEGLFPSEPH